MLSTCLIPTFTVNLYEILRNWYHIFSSRKLWHFYDWEILSFNCLLWSFKLYIVNLNKRTTKPWCFIQHGLLPLCQVFEVPKNLWLAPNNCYINWLLCKTLGTWASLLSWVVLQTKLPIWHGWSHATLLILNTKFCLYYHHNTHIILELHVKQYSIAH